MQKIYCKYNKRLFIKTEIKRIVIYLTKTNFGGGKPLKSVPQVVQ